MKKIYLLAIASCLLVLNGCNDDETYNKDNKTYNKEVGNETTKSAIEVGYVDEKGQIVLLVSQEDVIKEFNSKHSNMFLKYYDIEDRDPKSLESGPLLGFLYYDANEDITKAAVSEGLMKIKDEKKNRISYVLYFNNKKISNNGGNDNGGISWGSTIGGVGLTYGCKANSTCKDNCGFPYKNKSGTIVCRTCHDRGDAGIPPKCELYLY